MDIELILSVQSLESIHAQKEIKSTIITASILDSIVAELTSNATDLQQESFELIDAFHSPKLDFDEATNSYKMYCILCSFLKYFYSSSFFFSDFYYIFWVLLCSIKISNKEVLQNLYGNVETRAHMFRTRLLMVRQRLLRSGDFRLRGSRGVRVNSGSNSNASDAMGEQSVHEIYNIQDLLGATGTKVM